jgi:hypothetical protein
MKTEKYKSLLVIVTGFAVLYFILQLKPAGKYFLYASLLVGLLGIFVPFAGDWIVKGWHKLAEVLGWINSRILLSVIFFIFLTPMAIIYRLVAGKNLLQLKKPTTGSLYEERNYTYTGKDLEEPW